MSVPGPETGPGGTAQLVESPSLVNVERGGGEDESLSRPDLDLIYQ
jgi:hypothetical protein